MARRVRFVLAAIEYTVGHQMVEPVSQDRTRDLQARLKRVESPDPQEAVPEYHQRPAIPDNGQRARHGAGFVFEFIPTHDEK